ncbi:MaoC/PaaZ C-terminal domain-containing protein [Hydrogenophaga sp. BPS33]|uniref:MaoC/PaaZ C-terminal domain-containing protein n=1 Tax=Hydrogenophaga sp. BPS33 TaxID=2651974 RepID=UPI0013204527|nr:MaoC/PaaZ C-terminal domain-containing protein [Hydrogenophaga sp. BPS33]QHE85740.1 hypothetical protein F9K07_12920 [Hydrogenophaga sp. BPS33]
MPTLHHSAYARDPDGLLHERFGLPFEALEAGQIFEHRPGITFSQQENVDEALSTFNAAQIHTDEAYAARTAWQGPLMVSTWTLQRLIGMTWKTFGLGRRRIEILHEVRMSTPVFAGDTLCARTEVLAVTDDARVRLRTEACNQRGDTVAWADYTVRMWRASELPERPGPAVDEARFASHVAAGPHTWVETYGLCFEDLRAGETFVHALRRTVEAHEIAAIARRALEWSPQHHDLAWCEALGESGCAIPQAWLVGLATALTTLTLGRVSANLGWTEVRFLRDARAGDSLQARSTIRELRSSRSRAHEGIAHVHTTLMNGQAQPVLDFQRALLVYRRGFEPAPRSAPDHTAAPI